MADPPPGQSDRRNFVEDMAKALGGRSIALTNGQPSAADLRAYFKTLAGDPNESKKAYNRYAEAFYVHIDMLPAATPGIDWRPNQPTVETGLKTCDSWAQIEPRTRMNDGSNRRILDCRGFSFIAADLLGAAEWQVMGYRAFLVPRRRDIPWHMAVEVHWTKSQGTNDMLVGTQQASDGGFPEEKARGYRNHSEVLGSVQETDPPSPTQAMALQAALRADPMPGDSRLKVVGTFPARQSAGSYPPRFVPGSRWG
jgi:hypothetical protein